MGSLTSLIKRLHFWRISGLLLVDGLLFGVTDPATAPSVVLIGGFLLLCITLYYLLDGVLMLSKLYGLPVRHKKRVLRTLTLLIGGVVALQSIGQLSSRDVVVLTPLTVLLYLYVAYIGSMKQRQTAKRW